MIKFFRKIRQNLLLENKTGKYLKYAIGEIVLVVIGILIALQINTWKENKKQQIVLDGYYEQILDDFKREKTYIKKITTFINSSMDSYNNYHKKYDSINLETEDFVSYLKQVQYISQYLKFNTHTIETILNTGEIKLFPETIRNKLMLLKQNQENLVIVNNGNNQIYITSLMKASELGFSLNPQEINNHPKLERELSKEINNVKLLLAAETAFALKNFTEMELKSRLEQILLEIEQIEDLINKERNKKLQ